MGIETWKIKKENPYFGCLILRKRMVHSIGGELGHTILGRNIVFPENIFFLLVLQQLRIISTQI